MSYKKLSNLTGWLVFTIALVVYLLSAQRTGSLWDCGEFIAGAYKLEVVHPPGAPLFLLIGRMFTWVATIFSDNPESIAFSVNLMSGICTAFAAGLIAWVTIILGRLALVGRGGEMTKGQEYSTLFAGLAAGLTTAFATSVWFSAVEGEVYAMSTFFTALTLWALIRWYELPDTAKADRWLVFAVYSAGLSIGVHLLSLLTFPALALFYYFKKYENHSFLGMVLAAAVGTALLGGVQFFIILGLPKLWLNLDFFMVNSMGMPLHSGLIPLALIVTGVIFLGLRIAHQRKSSLLQLFVAGGMMMVISYSTMGVVVIRANANTPINMNNPSNAARLLPYLNREQYGERPLLYGPWYGARPYDNEFSEKFDYVADSDGEGGSYQQVDERVSYIYNDNDKMFFPRMGDGTQNRAQLYERWRGGSTGKPSQVENFSYFWSYQINWMYWRYFMWNFAGRENGQQGFWPGDPSSGHWLSGITPLDEARLYETSAMPDRMRQDQSRNKYFMLPLIFGLLGLFFHLKERPNDAVGLLALFVITGIGIIVYSNQPPNEPRERDYVLAGSFFTFAIWVGMGAMFLFKALKEYLSGTRAAVAGGVIVLFAPAIMLAQNFDDHTRRHEKASRDYAHNFLESCAEDAIIFTYGDNDTYPLWYAQEVEGIRTDVRVVNLSLIAVDWYIEQLTRKVNDSDPLKLTIPMEAYRGNLRNLTPYFNRNNPNGNPAQDQVLNLANELVHIGTDQVGQTSNPRQPKSYFRSHRYVIPIDTTRVFENGMVTPSDTGQILPGIPLQFASDKTLIIKDELATLDIIVSNINERPIYFAVTCRSDKLFGLQDYMQLEGLGLRLIPIRTPTSPQRSQYGSVYGAGRVATDILHDNVVNKFKWGGFDTEEQYVNTSYGPSLQSFHLSMLRAGEALVEEGQNQKAIEISREYLQGFPQMNFPYDFRTMRMLTVMVAAGAYEEAKPYMQALAEETLQYLDFYSSIDVSDLEAGFQQDFSLSIRTKEDLLRVVQSQGDTEFLAQLQNMFSAYQLPDNPPVPTQPGGLQD